MNIVGAHMLYLVAYNILKLPVKSRVVLPAMQATPLRFLGREDPLEKGQRTHSSTLGLPWWLRP